MTRPLSPGRQNRILKVACIAGARPNFMKVAPIMRRFSEYPAFAPVLIHTGQHYDESMSKVFFQDLRLPKPDHYLGVGSGSHASQTAELLITLEKALLKESPDLVIVVGDVNSTLAASLVAAKLLIPVAHIEAGLRSFDRTMPEEINRLVTDALSDYLFTTCQDGVDNLRREGIAEEKIFNVGNVMIDTLLGCLSLSEHSRAIEELGLEPHGYAVMTLHRPSNVDDAPKLLQLLNLIDQIGEQLTVVFPVHPRTRAMLEKCPGKSFPISSDFAGSAAVSRGLRLIDPIGYLDFIRLMSKAVVVLTDSGGIQEETTVLSIPCITLRENTERPVTVAEGTNELAGTDPEKITSLWELAISGRWEKGRIPDLWDGKAAERIVSILMQKFEDGKL